MRKELYRKRVSDKICVCCKISLGDNPANRKCKTCLDKDNEYRRENRTQKVINSEREYRQKVWYKRCVWKSTQKDRLKKRTSKTGASVVKPIRLQTLRVLQLNKCFYCLTDMQVLNRKKSDGLTIERLNNNEPHTTKNCILCCNRCNCKRLSDKHTMDLADAFDLIFDRFEKSQTFPKFLKLFDQIQITTSPSQELIVGEHNVSETSDREKLHD